MAEEVAIKKWYDRYFSRYRILNLLAEDRKRNLRENIKLYIQYVLLKKDCSDYYNQYLNRYIFYESALNKKNYGNYDSILFARHFLGNDVVFVRLNQVMMFKLPLKCTRAIEEHNHMENVFGEELVDNRESGLEQSTFILNPFIKQVLDILNYNNIAIIAYENSLDGFEGLLENRLLRDFDEYSKEMDEIFFTDENYVIHENNESQKELMNLDIEDKLANRKRKVLLEILRDMGYPYLKDIVITSDYGLSSIDDNFYKSIIEESERKGEKPGLISNTRVLYAKLKGINMRNYVTPMANRYRYRPKRMTYAASTMYRCYVNQWLFNGIMESSLSYNFGFARLGIYQFSLAAWINQYVDYHQIDCVYFFYDNKECYDVYRMLYKESRAKLLYITEKTRLDEKIDTFLKIEVEANGIQEKICFLDLSEDKKISSYLKERLCEIVPELMILTIGLYDKIPKSTEEALNSYQSSFFGMTAYRKYKREINCANELLRLKPLEVMGYQEGKPIIREVQLTSYQIQVQKEIERGIMEFCQGYFEFTKECRTMNTIYSRDSSTNVACILRDAFVMGKVRKEKFSLYETLKKKSMIRKLYGLLKKILRKILAMKNEK